MEYLKFIGRPRFSTNLPNFFYDFNDGVRITVPEGKYHIDFVNLDNFLVRSLEFEGPQTITSEQKDYIFWRIEIKQKDEIICSFQYDAADKNICLNFLDGNMSLGDIIAAMQGVEVFRQKHNCHLFVLMQEKFVFLFQKNYPEINFLACGVNEKTDDFYAKLPEDIYATYHFGRMGLIQRYGEFFKIYPSDFRISGFLEYYFAKLGINITEWQTKKGLKYTKEIQMRIVQDPYVCISGRAAAIQKEWHNGDGWSKVVNYLKDLGYRVICLDDDITHSKSLTKALACGMECFADKCSWQERINLLYYADFLVGVSNDISWLAWALNKNVVLISGYTLPYTEFYTPYRVINYRVCNGCFNDVSTWKSPEEICPCENTDYYLECSNYISPVPVCRNIDKLMEDYHLLPKDRA